MTASRRRATDGPGKVLPDLRPETLAAGARVLFARRMGNLLPVGRCGGRLLGTELLALSQKLAQLTEETRFLYATTGIMQPGIL